MAQLKARQHATHQTAGQYTAGRRYARASAFWSATLLLVFLCHIGSASTAALARTLVVDCDATGASDQNPGTAHKPFRSINAAAQVAAPGDTVLVHAGIYRERVIPARGGTDDAPIVYRAAPGEAVYVKGSEKWQAPWAPLDGQPTLFRSRIDRKCIQAEQSPYQTTISVAPSDKSAAARPLTGEALKSPWPMTLGQIFVDGQPAVQVESLETLEATSGSWIVSADGLDLLLHLPQGIETPAEALVEWSVRDRVFAPRRRGLGHIHVIGFRFHHCANQGPFPQGGAVSPRTGRRWVFQGNEIRFAKTIGLDVGSETWNVEELRDTIDEDKRLLVHSGHTVRDNTIVDNGLCGIAGWNSPGVRICNNFIARNNRLRFSKANCEWEEWAGIKLHATNALIAGNILQDNEAAGIWIDNDYNGARITGNTVLGNRGYGIFLELGAGLVSVDNNVIAGTRFARDFYPGSGIYCHDASGVRVAHNLLLRNAGYGVCMRVVTARKVWDEVVNASNEEIVNNLFVDNGLGAIDLPCPTKRSQGNWSDDNLFLWKVERLKERNSFQFNKYQAQFSWEDVYARLRDLGTPNGREEPPPLPDLETWCKTPQLSWRQWSMMTGWDCGSKACAMGEANVDTGSMQVTIDMPEAAWQMNCLPVAGVKEDFTGKRIEIASGILPGPFQSMSPGRNTLSLHPRSFTASRQEAFATAMEAIPPVGDRVVSTDYLTEADGDANRSTLWCHGYQDGLNPPLDGEFRDFGHGRTTTLFARSTKGVSSSPAQSVLYRVREAGRYQIDIAAQLTQRRFASAGITRVQIYQLDAWREAAILQMTTELNTPDGHRGDELSDRFEFSDHIACPTGSYIGLRFQVVAPGPAPAGDGRLEIERFSLTRLR